MRDVIARRDIREIEKKLNTVRNNQEYFPGPRILNAQEIVQCFDELYKYLGVVRIFTPQSVELRKSAESEQPPSQVQKPNEEQSGHTGVSNP